MAHGETRSYWCPYLNPEDCGAIYDVPVSTWYLDAHARARIPESYEK